MSAKQFADVSTPAAEQHSRPLHASDGSCETRRAQALALAEAGLPLNARELAILLREELGHFYAKAKLGLFDDFLLRPALGTKRYSGVKVRRYLDGETLDVLSFGRRKR